MFKLSKLHKSLNHLKPWELKEILTSSKEHFVGRLYQWELEELHIATANSAFVVVSYETDAGAISNRLP